MRRFFTEPQNIVDHTARILEDASHITRVLRMEPGEHILLFDGTGWEYTAELTQIDTKECTANILSKAYSEQEPSVQVTIFQGIPKSGKMESIIQKSVELGVSSIVPTSLERCVAKLDRGKKETEKLKRWNKVALEAAKQCGRGKVPEVLPSVTIAKAIEQMQAMDLALMPYEVLGHQGECSLKSILQAKEYPSIGILIGPEGGFTDAEAAFAKAAGVKLVGLGKRILRTETVASAMLSMIMYEKNEM
ncbi:MAG: 16S rRNA (uracil(1498)-N(3))-methyltransferase [Clostridia bacterium]|nr:16S rRNA (uracil(1498)-N(3))-methyltransferase [Clostridia bacterium]